MHTTQGDGKSPKNCTPIALSDARSWNGRTVRRDAEGRFHLTDMWKAAGAEQRNKPKQWLSTQDSQELAKEITQRRNSAFEADTGFEPVVTVRGGSSAGTWACVEMAVAYAAYLDKAFYLWMIHTFLAARNGHLVPASAAVDLGPLLAEFGSLKSQLAEQGAALESMRCDMAEVVRPAPVRQETRDTHLLVVMAKEQGVCPCCRKRPVAAIGVVGRPEWMAGYCVQRYRGTRHGALAETWPVCGRECRGPLTGGSRSSRDEFARSRLERFAAYQRSVREWLSDHRPELFPPARP